MQAFFKPSMLENPWKQLEAQLAQDFPRTSASAPAQQPALKVEGGGPRSTGLPVGQEAQTPLPTEESKPLRFEGHQKPSSQAEEIGRVTGQGEMENGGGSISTAGPQALESAQGARGASLANALQDFDDEVRLPVRYLTGCSGRAL